MEILREGSIVIDDLDITSIPLTKLRSKVAIIPQDSVLFAKTIRFNVDPFGWYKDADIWDALKSVNLYQYVFDLPLQLEEMVHEGGSNFSIGQKQV
jgi:ABC-type multidrug transport system fused ATPase/permease subunit